MVNRILLWQSKEGSPSITHFIEGSDTKEILENVLEILPNPDILDEQQFRVSKLIIVCDMCYVVASKNDY